MTSPRCHAEHLARHSSHRQYADRLRQLGDVEAMLSYLAEDEPWLTTEENTLKRAAYFSAVDGIAEWVHQSQREVLGYPPPPWLRRLAEMWHVEHAAVISSSTPHVFSRGL